MSEVPGPGAELRPVRRRPSNRREMVVAAARRSFARDGYDRVTMADLAAEVGMTAGALYRHFASKAELLAEALTEAVRYSLPDRQDDLEFDEFLQNRARVAAAMPDLDLLWAMRADTLTREQGDSLLAGMLSINDAYRSHLSLARPDADHYDLTLLGWVIQSVLYSTHPSIVGLSEDAHTELMIGTCSQLVRTELPARRATSEPAKGIGLVPKARREALIVLAGRLFGSNGFSSTSLADIGAAAGTSGPTLYAHFTSKDDLMFAVLERLNHHLWYDLGEALDSSPSATAALRRAVASYVGVVRARPQIVSLLVTRHKGAEETSRSQREYVTEWVRLLMLIRPDVSKPACRALVQAAFRAINNLAWTSPEVRDDDFDDRVTHICMHILLGEDMDSING